MTNMKSSATYNPYFSQNFPKSMKPPYKGLPEDVRHIRSGKIQQVIGIGDDPYSTPGHHRVGRGDRPVELLVLGNRPRTLFVPAPRFVGHAPHKDLVIIRFNKDDHVGHDLAEHPFGEPGEVALGGFHRGVGIDQNVPRDPGNRLGRTLLEPFLVGPVERPHLIPILHKFLVFGYFEHERAKIDGLVFHPFAFEFGQRLVDNRGLTDPRHTRDNDLFSCHSSSLHQSFFAKERPHERVHLHDLLAGDLLVQPVRDTHGQEQPCTAHRTDNTKEVRDNTEDTDKHPTDDRDTGDVPVEILLQYLRISPVPGDRHAGHLDLPCNILGIETSGLDPEEREDRTADYHEGDIDAHPEEDFPGRMPETVRPPHPVSGTVDRRKIVHQAGLGRLAAEFPEDGDADVREEHPHHLDIGLEHPHENHWKDTGVDQFDREPGTGTPHLGVGKGDLDAGGFHVHDDQEDDDGCRKGQKIRTEILDEIRTVKHHREQTREEPDRVGVADCGPVDETVDDGLGDPGDDEETDTGADTPLGDHFIHQKDEHTADTDLDED